MHGRTNAATRRAFANYSKAIAGKQGFETGMIKDFVTKFRNYESDMKAAPELRAAFDNLKKQLGLRHAALEAESRKALTPVKYTITVTAK